MVGASADYRLERWGTLDDSSKIVSAWETRVLITLSQEADREARIHGALPMRGRSGNGTRMPVIVEVRRTGHATVLGALTRISPRVSPAS
jgi:hypothetical protein